MRQIASFTGDHDRLEKGMYVSRVDGDVIAYDLRMKKPNQGDSLSNGALHTFEHLFATFARNSRYDQGVIYAGSMGCQTGFYLLLQDAVSRQEALELVREIFRFIAGFEGEIPGSKRWACGNYLEHDLSGAKAVAADMLTVLEDWNEGRMQYATHT